MKRIKYNKEDNISKNNNCTDLPLAASKQGHPSMELNIINTATYFSPLLVLKR